MSGFLFGIFILAGPIFTFDGVVQLCVRKKTGLWKEGLATLLAGGIIAVLPILFVPLLGLLLWY